jgi:TfoX N-terminal domain
MAYDEALARRLRSLLGEEIGLREKKMFGGLAFLIDGNMSVSASGQGGLLLRVDPADMERLAEADHAEQAEMRGRSMTGWLRIAPAAIATDEQLAEWVSIGLKYARSLPPKR